MALYTRIVALPTFIGKLDLLDNSFEIDDFFDKC